MDKKIQRNSALELLRIVAMLLIVESHFVVHGVYHALNEAGMPSGIAEHASSWQMHFTNFNSFGGGLGICIFLLVTGYFAVDRQVKARKLLLLASNVFLYSWVIMALVRALVPELCPDGAISWNLMPLWVGESWFVSCYIAFFCFVPFYNKFLRLLGQREYLLFLAVFFLVQRVLPILGYHNYMNDSQLILFGLVYAIGGYLRLFCQDRLVRSNHRRYVLYTLAAYGVLMLLSAVVEGHGIYYDLGSLAQILSDARIIMHVLMAVAMLMAFATMKPFYNKWINMLAGTVLGVYLIHDNTFMRTIIWDRILPNAEYFASDYYVLFMLGKVAGVFVVCAGIELLRQKCLEPWQERLIDRVYPPICSLVQGIWRRLARALGAKEGI